MYLKKITSTKFIILLFTSCLPIFAVSQNSITTGSIRGCYVWGWEGALGSQQLNNASITNNHIIQTHPNSTNVNSISFNGSNSVLQLNGSESVVLGTPTNVFCPKSGSNVQYIYSIKDYRFNPTNGYCGTLSNPLPKAPSGGDGNIRVTISFNNMPSDYTGSCYGNVGCGELNAEVTLFDKDGINYGTQTNGGMCGGRPAFVYIIPYTTLEKTQFMVCHRIFHKACSSSGSYHPGGISSASVEMDIESNLF